MVRREGAWLWGANGFPPSGAAGGSGKALLAPPRKTLRTQREPNPRNTDIEKLSIGNGFYADKLGKNLRLPIGSRACLACSLIFPAYNDIFLVKTHFMQLFF